MQETPDSESAPALAPEATDVPEAPPSSPPGHTRNRLARAARLLALFATGQAAVQLLNVAAGLILIRVLPKEAYAQFTLGNSVLSLISGLIEFGFAPAIVALVGEKVHDRVLLGKYIHTACALRDRLLMIVAPIVAIGMVAVGMRQGWSPWLLICLALVAVGTSFAQGRVAYFTTPLRMHRLLHLIYPVQILGVLARIGAIILIYSMGWLGAVAAFSIQMVTTGSVAMALKRRAAPLYQPTSSVEPAVRRRMIHHLSPTIPTHLFVVFQGNILIILVTFFGSSDNIAEIGALGRLAQLFVFAWALHTMIALPWIARAPREKLLPRYLVVATYPILLSALVVVAAFLFPDPLLLLLGPQYAHLRAEVSWMVLAGAIHYVGGTLYHVHFARRWIYWWSSIAQILGILAVQTLGVLLLDLSQTLEAVFFALMTNMGILVVSVAVGIYGFRHGPRMEATEGRDAA